MGWGCARARRRWYAAAVPILIGIDIGTSGAKAVACTTRGRLVAESLSPHPSSHPHPGWSEQDPEDWWRSCCRAVRGLFSKGGSRASPRDVAAIGLSGQLHGAVLLGSDAADGSGRAKALRPAILWNDQRTAEECREIEGAAGGRAALVRIAGNAALPGFTLPKLLWVRKHEPRVWKLVRRAMLPKDFIRLRMTGREATDVGDASGTLLFDIAGRAWSRRMFDLVDLDPALLPPVLESTEHSGELTPWAARALGLPAGTPVIAGSGDNQCGAVGAGVVEPGMAMAMLGTSGVILAHAGAPRFDLPERGRGASTPKPASSPAGRLHCMAAATGTKDDPSGWCVTGVMLSAAGALAWCRDTIAPGVAFDELVKEAATAPPGCDGLVFLPYLTGERCPHPDPLARAGWIGLTARHRRAHLVRSVLEGVSFGMGHMVDLIRGLGIRVSSVRLSGGGNRSRLWRQIQADVYQCPVSTTNTESGGTALGAAILAGIGVDLWPSVPAACRAVVGVKGTLEPLRSSARLYEQPQQVYRALYADLRARFPDMARISHSDTRTRGTRDAAS